MKATTCPKCGKPATTRREPFGSDSRGIPGGASMARIVRCPDCGDFTVQGFHESAPPPKK